MLITRGGRQKTFYVLILSIHLGLGVAVELSTRRFKIYHISFYTSPSPSNNRELQKHLKKMCAAWYRKRTKKNIQMPYN